MVRSLTYLLLYVDDIVLADNHSLYIYYLIHQLKTQFDMTDLDSLPYFLGLEIKCVSSSICVTQTKYTKDLLLKFDMVEAKVCSTPCSTSSLASNSDTSLCSPEVATTASRSIVGV